jgi:hypothetical protein
VVGWFAVELDAFRFDSDFIVDEDEAIDLVADLCG